ncbi:UNVERIFIED_ORG: hypothetical protein J2W38_003759 [Variovorax paradoxus]|nr:hypothetical protein [Variovorax paradoxus]
MASESFTLTAADYERLQKVVLRRLGRKPGLSAIMFWMRASIWIVVGLTVAAYVHFMRDYSELPHMWFVTCLVVLVFVLMMVLPGISQAVWRRHLLAPDGAFLAPQTIDVTDSALLIESSTARSELLWGAFLARDEDDVNHYLFLDATHAVVLPRAVVAASFADRFERFTAHLKNGP